MNKIIKQDYDVEESKEESPEMSKKQRDYMIDKNQKHIMEFIQENNYLLIKGDGSIKLYYSLRKLAGDINVSPSGISKKLKISNYCICVPKKSTEVFYIHNLKE